MADPTKASSAPVRSVGDTVSRSRSIRPGRARRARRKPPIRPAAPVMTMTWSLTSFGTAPRVCVGGPAWPIACRNRSNSTITVGTSPPSSQGADLPWVPSTFSSAGAGPVGLTAAIELRRRASPAASSTSCSNRRSTPRRSASSRGPWRSSRAWACCGRSLDAAVPMRGQIVYVNGERGRPAGAAAAAGHPVRVHRAAAVRDRADAARAAGRARHPIERGIRAGRRSSRTTTA